MRTGPVACFENGHRGAVGEAGTTCLACPIGHGPGTQWGGRGDSHKAPLSLRFFRLCSLSGTGTVVLPLILVSPDAVCRNGGKS